MDTYEGAEHLDCQHQASSVRIASFAGIEPAKLLLCHLGEWAQDGCSDDIVSYVAGRKLQG